jgi:beta-lactamase regulating signal transducer with metallopeptidase domain
VTVSFPVIIGILSKIDFSAFSNDKSNISSVAVVEPAQINFTPSVDVSKPISNEVVPEYIEAEISTVYSEAKEENPVMFSITDLLKFIPIVLSLLWSVVASVLVIRLLRSYKKIQSVKRTATNYDVSHFKKVRDLLSKYKFNRKIKIATSSEIDIPIAAGFRNPTVLIPENLISKLSSDELEIVLIHEITHLIRRDDWANLVQQLLTSLNFFHPVVHWLNRRLNLTREIACDESVIRYVGNPKIYAECLTKTLQLTIGSGTTLMSNAYTGDKQIFQRLKEILLWNNRNNSRFNSIKLAMTTLVIAAMAVVFVKVTPAVAFPGQYLTYDELHSSINGLISSDKKVMVSKDFINNSSKITSNEISIKDNTANKPDKKQSITELRDELNALREDERSAMENLKIKPILLANNSDSTSPHNPNTKFDFTGTIRNINNDLVTYGWDDGYNSIVIKVKGDVEFSNNVSSIKSISKGGFFEIYITKDGKNSTIKVIPDENGELQYRFYSDKNSIGSSSYDKDWFEDMLLESAYKLGVGAEERVAWILKIGGVEKVFEDIAYIESDYTLGIYYTYLIENANLSESHYLKIIRGVSVNISSDYTKSKVLIAISPSVIGNKNLLLNYIRAVKTISSDYETGKTLSNFIFDAKTDETILKAVFEVIEGIQSDYEKAKILSSMSSAIQDNKNLLKNYISAVNTIDSDYETRRTLEKLSFDAKTDPIILKTVLEIAREISSDYEKRVILTGIVDQIKNNKELLKEYISIVSTINSDYETRSTLEKLSFDAKTDPTILKAVLDIAQEISSDYEKRVILTGIVGQIKNNKELLKEYISIVSTINSDYERRHTLENLSFDAETDPTILKAVLEIAKNIDSDYEKCKVLDMFIDANKIDRKSVLELIKITNSISSDYSKGNVLERLVPHCRGDQELEEVLLTAIKSISSDYEKSKLLLLFYEHK